MKTLQELYDEVVGDDGKKGAFVEALRATEVADFMAGHDCSATEEEVREFLDGRSGENDSIELTAQELGDVAGGTRLTHACVTYEDSCDCSDTCVRDCC